MVGFADEVWWSRVARPSLHAWQSPADPVRLSEPVPIRHDRDPLAVACYGLFLCPMLVNVMPAKQLLLRFVSGRPVSAVTITVLTAWSAQLARGGTTTLVLIWDNASWHISRAVRDWIRQHNRAVKQGARGVRILAVRLPIKSPWLNPIEAKWVHGKRAIVATRRLLTAQELVDRVCAYYGCAQEPLVVQPQRVA